MPSFRDAKTAYSSQRTARTSSSWDRCSTTSRPGDRGREDDLEPELPALIARLLELDPLHLGAPRLEDREHGSERLVGTQVDLEAAGRPAPSDDVALRPAEGPEAEEHDPGPEERARVVAGADSHPDRGHDPEPGGGRQPADVETLAHDRARAEEADARDDLRRDPRRVGADDVRAADEEVVEAVGGDEGEERGADADEHVRPQARGPLSPFALETDQPAQRGGHDEPERDLADGDVGDHAAAFDWMPKICSIPAAARSMRRSSSSRVKAFRSAVDCTSISRPSPRMTTFMSTSAVESSP